MSTFSKVMIRVFLKSFKRGILKIINFASQVLKQNETAIIEAEIAGNHISKETLTSKAATMAIRQAANNAKRDHKVLIL